MDGEFDSVEFIKNIKKIEKISDNLSVNLYDNTFMIRVFNKIKKSGKDITTYNRDNMKNYYRDDPIFLIQQFYIPSDPKRYIEIKETLRRNLENSKFEKIYLLNEKIYTLEELGLMKESEKIKQVNNGKRLTFNEFLKFTKNLNGYYVLSNSDIFFDDSIDNIKKGLLGRTKSIECLTRYEYKNEENLDNCKIIESKESQDTWILHSKFADIILDSDFSLGVPGCDNRISYLFYRKKYLILNSQYKIKTYHIHKSDNRNYSRRIPGPYLFPEIFKENNVKNEKNKENNKSPE